MPRSPSYPYPSASDLAPNDINVRSPSLDPEAWRYATPFSELPEQQRLRWLRESRMHGRAEACRIGSDAFDLRRDVTVVDACETVMHLLRALTGSLQVLEFTPGASSTFIEAALACAFVARQAASALTVIATAAPPGERDA